MLQGIHTVDLGVYHEFAVFVKKKTNKNTLTFYVRNYLLRIFFEHCCKDVDSARRNKLLRIYLPIPSLPALRVIRASLVELKGKSKQQNGSMYLHREKNNVRLKGAREV